MRRGLATLAWACAASTGCGPGEPTASPGPSASASAAATPCTPRSGEKIGFHFVRVCPPGEPGFWISAVPIGCSAGRHDEVTCPTVTALAHPITASPAPIQPVLAAVIDSDTAGRLCFFRMGGRLPTRKERAQARALSGLSTVLVSEPGTESERFHFGELPEWVFEDATQACVAGVPRPGCAHGWFPAVNAGNAVPWRGLRACSAQHHPSAPADVVAAPIGEGCAVPAVSWSTTEPTTAIGCGVRSPAFDVVRGAATDVFTLQCAAPTELAHPANEPKDLAAYRCVLPESALGTFDIAGR